MIPSIEEDAGEAVSLPDEKKLTRHTASVSNDQKQSASFSYTKFD